MPVPQRLGASHVQTPVAEADTPIASQPGGGDRVVADLPMGYAVVATEEVPVTTAVRVREADDEVCVKRHTARCCFLSSSPPARCEVSRRMRDDSR